MVAQAEQRCFSCSLCRPGRVVLIHKTAINAIRKEAARYNIDA
jgi:hypothetical protein